MSIENEKTLEVYQNTANMYLENSIKHDNLDLEKARHKREKLEKFLRMNIGSLPKGTKVFEIGAGNGANAKYIENLGYEVTASDNAKAFIEAIKENGLKTIQFNVLKDEFKETYYGIFCWRVFVHFTKEDALKVLQKTYDALENGGLFIFNAINRETREVDEEWVDFSSEYHMGVDRYYKYFSEEELNEIIAKTKYQIHSFHKEGRR